jgi:hypothetical protein
MIAWPTGVHAEQWNSGPALARSDCEAGLRAASQPSIPGRDTRLSDSRLRSRRNVLGELRRRLRRTARQSACCARSRSLSCSGNGWTGSTRSTVQRHGLASLGCRDQDGVDGPAVDETDHENELCVRKETRIETGSSRSMRRGNHRIATALATIRGSDGDVFRVTSTGRSLPRTAAGPRDSQFLGARCCRSRVRSRAPSRPCVSQPGASGAFPARRLPLPPSIVSAGRP